MADKNEYVIDTELNTSGIESGIADISKLFDKLNSTVVDVGKAIQTSMESGFKDVVTAVSETTNAVKVLDTTTQTTGKNIQNSIGGAAGSVTASVNNLTDVINKNSNAQNINSSAIQNTSEHAKKAGNIFSTLIKKLEAQSSSFKKLLSPTTKITSVFKSLQTLVKKTGNRFSNLTKNANKQASSFKSLLHQVLKYGLGIRSLYVLLNKLRNALIEGFKNLAQFNDGVNPTNTALSNLKSTLTQMKNTFATAFAPILTTVEPILTSFLDKINQVVTAVGMLIAKLTGASSFTKAIKVQEDYAKSLSSTASSAEDAKNQVLSLDELNILSTDSSSGSSTTTDPNTMFETVDIDDTLFSGFSDSWEKYGKPVIDSILNAFNSVNNLINTMKASFSEVWNNGTGEKVAGHLLSIFTELANTIANLANNFSNAWNTDNVGTDIAQNLLNIINDIVGAIDGMSQATSNWAANLDFTPILTAFNGLLESIEPLIDTISTGLASAYENVLLPLASWVIEEAAPVALDVFSGAIDVLNSAIETLEPMGVWLWDNFLNPIAEWTGGIITAVLEDVATALNDISDWIKENQETIETVAIIIASFVSAWAIVDVATIIYGIVAALATFVVTGGLATAVAGALAAAVAVLTSPITIAIVVIGALIAIGVLLYKNWDTIKAKAGELWEKIKTTVVNTITKIKTSISNTLEAISTTWNAIWTGMKVAVINIFEDIWKGIKRVINTILSGIETMANGVVNGINTMINALNSLSFSIPDWVPAIGGNTLSLNIPTINNVSLPRLATGTVVPRQSSEFAAILGDNNKETEVVSPLSTIKQALAEALEEGDFVYYLKEIAGNTEETAKKDMTVKIGDREIARAAQRGQRSMGVTLRTT